MSDEKPEEIVYAPGVQLPSPPPRRPAVRQAMLFGVLPLLIVVAITLLRFNSGYDRGPGKLTACKSHCKNLATALEMYASDSKGHYPVSLAQVIQGNYLKLIPTCPSAGKDTYSESYVVAQTPDRFTFYCAGLNHEKSYTDFSKDSTNFPQYFCDQGLQDHP